MNLNMDNLSKEIGRIGCARRARGARAACLSNQVVQIAKQPTTHVVIATIIIIIITIVTIINAII